MGSQSKRQKCVLRGSLYGDNFVIISKDSRFSASGNGNNQIKIWNLIEKKIAYLQVANV